MTWEFDGDKRRIYEVPENSSFSTDGNGYRVYVPNNIPSSEIDVFDTTFSIWSKWVDYHNSNKWALLAFDISGGAFRFTDNLGNDIFALPDLRLVNDWQIVPANYPHNLTIQGNLYPNSLSKIDFDTNRITSIPVPSPRIQFSDRGERTVLQGGGTGTNRNPEIIFG